VNGRTGDEGARCCELAETAIEIGYSSATINRRSGECGLHAC